MPTDFIRNIRPGWDSRLRLHNNNIIAIAALSWVRLMFIMYTIYIISWSQHQHPLQVRFYHKTTSIIFSVMSWSPIIFMIVIVGVYKEKLTKTCSIEMWRGRFTLFPSFLSYLANFMLLSEYKYRAFVLRIIIIILIFLSFVYTLQALSVHLVSLSECHFKSE